MDNSELGESWNGFRFKFLEPKEYDRALKFMEDYLYTSLEPIGYSKEYPDVLNNLFRAMMENGSNLSYIAVHIETGEIAACRMVDIIVKDKSHDPPAFQEKRNENILVLCDEICKDEDLFGNYEISQYADMFGMVVDPKFRRRGLATEMYARGLNFLKRRGFKIVKCGFISPYSRLAGYKNGYKEFARRYFHDCKDSEGNTLNPNSDPNDFVCFGVFILD